MRVAIIGANGQLGSDLLEAFSRKHTVTGLTHQELEVTEIDSVKATLGDLKPDIVLNTSAFHNVPLCEQDPEKAFAVNGQGALNLARVCTDIQAKLVHYSTDYVFDGNQKVAYAETDLTNPLNVYAVTKLAGEKFVLSYATKPYVIRVSGIYGKVPCRAKGGNFVTTMMKLSKEKPEVRVVNDEVLTPTSTRSIAETTLDLLSKDSFGLYHMTSEGCCSWYEFAAAIWEIMGLKTPLYPASVYDNPVLVKRPFYSVLENANLKKAGVKDMPYWKDELHEFLKRNYL